MANPSQSSPRDNLPTVVHGVGDETAAGPHSDKTVTKGDFVPTRLAHYKVLHKLGQGGMGWVLLAEDTKLARRVALKVMRRQHAEDEESRQRFKREAQAAAALNHDHIITIYQVDEDRGVPFFVMELLEGGTLQQRLEYPKPLSIGAAVRIAREIAEGLRHAHERGVVHRDIKPANIWLESPKGRVKILDFGLARHRDTKSGLTQQGEIVGTPHYMAPEQARGKAIDPRTDLFSLGCILYRMTAGKLPFAGETLLATLTAIAVDMPTPVRDLNPLVPPALADLIWRLLAKEPGDRPASAAEVIDDLVAIERDVAGGSRSGFNIEVPLSIRRQNQTPLTPFTSTLPHVAAAPSTKAPVAASAPARSASPPSVRTRWLVAVLALAIVGPLLVGLLAWMLSGLWSSSPPPLPRSTASTGRSAPQHKPDLRVVESLAVGSHALSREIGQWALARAGATVQIRDGNVITQIPNGQVLPESAFVLVAIDLHGDAGLTDNDLSRLTGLSNLDALDLSETPISDAGLVQLTDIASLTRVNLEGTRVTDAGIAHLVRQCPNITRLLIGRTGCLQSVVKHIAVLRQLQHLSLDGLPIADAELSELVQLAHLEELNLSDTKISDRGLTVLGQLAYLSRLTLDRTAISDQGVAAIAAWGRLRELSLSGCDDVSNAALPRLAGLRLDSLNISGADQIDDQGLAHLAAVPSLKLVEVSTGQFSSRARQKLQAKLPDCKINLVETGSRSRG
jgi:serine/threonine protein kinase